MKSIAALILSAVAATGATAQASEVGEWHCATLKDALAISIDDGKVRVNNVLLSREKDFMSGAPIVSISASITNYSERKAAASIEIVSFKSDNPSATDFAISAQPDFGMIGPSKSDTLKRSILLSSDTIQSSQPACIRVSLHYF